MLEKYNPIAFGAHIKSEVFFLLFYYIYSKFPSFLLISFVIFLALGFFLPNTRPARSPAKTNRRRVSILWISFATAATITVSLSLAAGMVAAGRRCGLFFFP